MFFFIGGIQPRTIELEKSPSPCPSCGLFQAKIKRTDHYLSIFFLPVLRVKKGEPFVVCERCGTYLSGHRGDDPHTKWNDSGIRCPHCGRQVEQGFSYCPFCGEKL